MPAATDTPSPVPLRARAARFLALAAVTIMLGLAGPAPADPGASSGIQWEAPAGLAGVDAYRLDFLGASGLVPMAAPLAPLSQAPDTRPIALVPFGAMAAPEAPEAPAAETRTIRPVATNPLGGIDQQADRAARRGSYSLSDAVREAGWRKATAERLHRMAPSRPRF